MFNHNLEETTAEKGISWGNSLAPRHLWQNIYQAYKKVWKWNILIKSRLSSIVWLK